MPEHPPRRVGVNYRRQVSDGNYGTEACEVSLEWYVEFEDDAHLDQEAAQEMLSQAREIVLAQLRGSNNVSVRAAVMLGPRTTAPARSAAAVPADDDETPF